MSDDPCGAHPISLADQRMVERMKRESHERAMSAARARQFAHYADQAIGVVTDVEETDDGLVVHAQIRKIAATIAIPEELLLERNTVQFLADPRFGFVAEPSFFADPSAKPGAVLRAVPSRRVRFARWRQRVRVRLAERIGGQDLHEDCY